MLVKKICKVHCRFKIYETLNLFSKKGNNFQFSSDNLHIDIYVCGHNFEKNAFLIKRTGVHMLIVLSKLNSKF